MYQPETYTIALLFMILSMLCWGSWANTMKLCPGYRFQLFYWDYVIGLFVGTLILGLTMGSAGTQGLPFLRDIANADSHHIWLALAGGAIFNVANLLLVAAIDIAGLAAEPRCSRRHLAARFREQVGLPPKAAARILRFDRAARALRSGAHPSLAELARLGLSDERLDALAAELSGILTHMDVLGAITVWGPTDPRSWRAAGVPPLFHGNPQATPADWGILDPAPPPTPTPQAQRPPPDAPRVPTATPAHARGRGGGTPLRPPPHELEPAPPSEEEAAEREV